MPSRPDRSRVPSLGAHLVPDGVAFTVWAPERSRVELEWETPEGRQGRTALVRRAEGVWSTTVAGLGAGACYGYRLDGEGPWPDPYARALPQGVHGRAEVVDPSAFGWTADGWRGLDPDRLVVYELHVGTFTPEGTFDAAIGQLDELARLGVTAIELMPVASFPGRWNWGYDGVGLFAPAHVYGGAHGLRRLVDAAHARELGVILDVVYNHLGPSGNYLRAFSPHYFTDRYHTPWGEALNYDGRHSRRVRDWAIDNARMWLTEYRADGLRLDATAEIHDAGRRHVLRELSDRCRAAAGRPIVLIAEDNRNDARLIHRSLRLDAFWADDFHHALRTLVTDECEGYYADYPGTSAALARTIRRGVLYEGQRSAFLGRARGRPAGRTPASAFVFCTENHDQVGNRALGERLAHLVPPAVYRAASALLLLAPQTPMLFMGQEFAASTPFQYFTDHEPDLGRLVTEGRRKEFAGFAAFAERPQTVPDPQDEATFRRSKLDLAERERNAGVYRLYRDLLALRRDDPVLRARDRSALGATALGPRALALRLGAGAERRLLVVNLGPALERRLPARLSAAGDWRPLVGTEDRLYGGAGVAASVEGGRVRVPAVGAWLFAPTSRPRGGADPSVADAHS